MTKVKLTTLAQVAQLHIGDIIKRFPSCGAPEEIYNEASEQNTDTYEIKSINPEHDMIGDYKIFCVNADQGEGN